MARTTLTGIQKALIVFGIVLVAVGFLLFYLAGIYEAQYYGPVAGFALIFVAVLMQVGKRYS